jgi:hypothetical protein
MIGDYSDQLGITETLRALLLFERLDPLETDQCLVHEDCRLDRDVGKACLLTRARPRRRLLLRVSRCNSEELRTISGRAARTLSNWVDSSSLRRRPGPVLRRQGDKVKLTVGGRVLAQELAAWRAPEVLPSNPWGWGSHKATKAMMQTPEGAASVAYDLIRTYRTIFALRGVADPPHLDDEDREALDAAFGPRAEPAPVFLGSGKFEFALGLGVTLRSDSPMVSL